MTADDVKRLQGEKEVLQKQLEQMKEAGVREAAKLTEFQRTNGNLVAERQKLVDETRKLKEDSQKQLESHKAELVALESKRKEEEAKSADKIDPLRRIARKYKTQYEELKAEHDRILADAERDAAATVAETAAASAKAEEDAAAAAAKNEASTDAGGADAAKLQELEERVAQLTAELEQLKKDNEALRAVEEKTKNVLKPLRQRLATLAKEKETLSRDLGEARSKIEALEQGGEESSVRSAALRSQLEGRLTRLERENSDLAAAKQVLESELELLNQRVPILQRQIDAYQKQQAQAAGVKAGVQDKVAPENPPTANIKPMATAVAPQRPTVPTSTGAGALLHRTTPTASIRPMAMPQRTVTSATVAPMAPPVAVTPPTPRTEEEAPAAEPVASTSAASAAPAPDDGGERNRKRSRTVEEVDSGDEQELKRLRAVSSESAEELVVEEESTVVIIAPPAEEPEESPEEVVVLESRSDEVELVIDDEADEMMESEEEDKVESADVAEEEGEEEEEIEVEDQREEAEDSAGAVQNVQDVVDDNDPAPAAGTSSDPIIVESVEEIDAEAFAPSASGAGDSGVRTVRAPLVSRAPARADRLPSIGRNTLPFEDAGDDGIVPSTPVLLRPKTNDQAVSSPQVNTRFNFGSAPELTSAQPGSSASMLLLGPQHGMLSLESPGMEDTRMDLSQLDEGTGRSVPTTPLQVSPLAELVIAAPVAEHAESSEEVVVVPEEQADLEGGPDLESDAAAELDLLGEDDLVGGAESRDSSDPQAPPVVVVEPESVATEQQAVQTAGDVEESPALAVSSTTVEVAQNSAPAAAAPAAAAVTSATAPTIIRHAAR